MTEVARIHSRPLDRSRPLWEMYLIEGLEEGRFAILSKSHQTLVDGISTIDLGQVISAQKRLLYPTAAWPESENTRVPRDCSVPISAYASPLRRPHCAYRTRLEQDILHEKDRLVYERRSDQGARRR